MQLSSIPLPLLSLIPLLLITTPVVLAGPAIPNGYKSVVFHDEFNSNSIDRNIWKLNTGTAYPGGPANWGTGEIQTYADSPDNVQVRDGTLSITPLKNGDQWTSARLETKGNVDFSCPAGGKLLVEARIKLGAAPADSQVGIWPAFWLLGSAYRGVHTNWPSVGEIDIMESVNGESRTWGTIHCGDSPLGGPCNEPIGIGAESPLRRDSPWNLFAVEIDRSSSPERMIWYTNYFPFMSLTSEDVGDDAWESLAGGPKMMLLNVAVGGAFPNAIAKQTTPDANTKDGKGAGMEVDYVAVYST